MSKGCNAVSPITTESPFSYSHDQTDSIAVESIFLHPVKLISCNLEKIYRLRYMGGATGASQLFYENDIQNASVGGRELDHDESLCVQERHDSDQDAMNLKLTGARRTLNFNPDDSSFDYLETRDLRDSPMPNLDLGVGTRFSCSQVGEGRSHVDEEIPSLIEQMKNCYTMRKCDYLPPVQNPDSGPYGYRPGPFSGQEFSPLEQRNAFFPPVERSFQRFHQDAQNFPMYGPDPLVERMDLLNQEGMMPLHGLRRSFSSIPEERPDCFCPPRDTYGNLQSFKSSPRANLENLYHSQEMPERFIQNMGSDPYNNPNMRSPFLPQGLGFQPPFVKPHLGSHLPVLELHSPRKSGPGMFSENFGGEFLSPGSISVLHVQGHVNSSLPSTPKTPMEGNLSLLNSPNSAQNINTALYKTELCRSWEETGSCRYGPKCQFAHGREELRPVARHPKYKTEVCRTFSTNGTCPYGKRCRFIHKSSLAEGPESVKRTLSEDIAMLMKSERSQVTPEPVHSGTTKDKGELAPNSTPTTPRRRLKIFAESGKTFGLEEGQLVHEKLP